MEEITYASLSIANVVTTQLALMATEAPIDTTLVSRVEAKPMLLDSSSPHTAAGSPDAVTMPDEKLPFPIVA